MLGPEKKRKTNLRKDSFPYVPPSFESIFIIDLRSGVFFVSIDRKFSPKSRSREKDGYKSTANQRERGASLGICHDDD